MNFINRAFRVLLRYKKHNACFFKRLNCLLIGQIDLHKTAIIEPKADLIIDSYSDLDNVITVGQGTIIKDYARICPRAGFIKIGDLCSINSFCILLGYGGITIGNQVRIAAQTSIIAFNHNFDDVEQTIHHQGYNAKGVVIEDNVWIGAGVRILDGVTIGAGSVIGAASVVTKDIAPYSVAAGVPAKVIKSRQKQFFS
jgi:acetyltransferase-like isoleucine patch superfamily enzyme